MPRFYVDMLLVPSTTYGLPFMVSRHIHILRLKLDDKIELFNGDGNNYSAKIIGITRREVKIIVLGVSTADNASKLSVILAMSILSSDKFDLALQKSVELGITKIIPIYTQHTQRFSPEKLVTKMEHWQNVMIAASEQCGRADLAQLCSPCELNQILPKFDQEGKFILSPYHFNNAKLKEQYKNIVLLIGPEGGFTESEVDLAIQHGFVSLVLGPRILRAETAAIAGLSYLHTKFGDFM